MITHFVNCCIIINLFLIIYVLLGFAAGPQKYETGGGSDYVCLPVDPVLDSDPSDRLHGNRAYLYGTEYDGPPTDLSNLHDHEAPCVVCQSDRRSMLMIPARDQCYPGWTVEYTGFLSSSYHRAERASHVCVDKDAEAIQEGTSTTQASAKFYQTEVRCGAIPCAIYPDGKNLKCAVCTR